MANVEVKTVKLSEIRLNPDNPRTISKKKMEYLVKSLNDLPDMLKIRPIVVDETMTCLGGNMRTLALRKAGAGEATVAIVTGLTKEQKREFVIKDNSNFGDWDFDLLSSWDDLPLQEWGINIPGLADDPNAEWKGMPEFEQKDLSAFQSIHVHFKNQSDIKEFAELVGQKIGEKTRSIWFPEAEKINMTDVYNGS